MAEKWDDIEKIKQDKPFVSCEEVYELNYLANKYNVPKLIVKLCCKKIDAPHPREKVENCIKRMKKMIFKKD